MDGRLKNDLPAQLAPLLLGGLLAGLVGASTLFAQDADPALPPLPAAGESLTSQPLPLPAAELISDGSASALSGETVREGSVPIDGIPDNAAPSSSAATEIVPSSPLLELVEFRQMPLGAALRVLHFTGS